MQSPAVSEVYTPTLPNQLQDIPFTQHYPEQGYSIAYELGPEGQETPEGGNTAIFRILPGGITEPFHVTKSEPEATYTINVISGRGQIIRATADGKVEKIALEPGSKVVVNPNETLAYQNTGDDEDLILHDTAIPAYKDGDDLDLRESLTPAYPPEAPAGYTSVLAKVGNGEQTISVPDEFTELMTGALLNLRTERQRQVQNFFAELGNRIDQIPELAPVIEYAAQNPEKTYKLFGKYIEVVRKLSSLDEQELDQIEASHHRLQTVRTQVSSASSRNAISILGLLDDEARAEMARDAARAMNPESPYLEPALDDFISRAKKGHQKSTEGKTPKDGDPEWDKTLWSHTLITDPEALLHFTLAHYMERYFSQTLAAQGVAFAAEEKDYFLNAMSDVMMLDHYSENRFADILTIWAKPHEQGGTGWTKPYRFDAFKPKVQPET